MGHPNNRSARFRLPILSAVLPIQRAQIPGEIIAGITLAALAVPEVMGYAKIAGMPVITGIYTLLIPIVIFAFFGSSRHLVVGAESALAAMLASGLIGMAAAGSSEYVALAMLLALMVGALLVLASVIGLGFMADFLSRTVLVGFLTGVGIQIAIGQIAGMLGVAGHGLGAVQKVWSDLQLIESVNYASLATASATIAFVVGSKWISKKLPASMIAVVAAITLSWALDWGAYMHVVGSVPSGLPELGLPKVDLSIELFRKLLPTALAMVVVILALSAATARAFAMRHNERHDDTSDLMGLGLANIGAGLSGTFIVCGSPSKTQMVDQAGGRSQLAQLVTAAVVMLILLFVTAPLAYLPEAVLSGIVFLIGLNLIDVAGMAKIFNEKPSEFWVALGTVLMVVFLGVEEGIILAVVLSLLLQTRHGYRSRNHLLTRAESGAWRALPLSSVARVTSGLLIYRFTHCLYYANAPRLSEEVFELVESAGRRLEWFCIDLSAVDDLDYTSVEALRWIQRTLQEQGIRLVIAHTFHDDDAGSRETLRRVIGKDAVYDTLEEVVEAYERRSARH